MTRASNAKTVAGATREAVTSRYKSLPPLPDLPTVTSWLRELGRNLEDGGADVRLYCEGASWADARWEVGCNWTGMQDDWPGPRHNEHVPEGGKRFDAVAAARRLLSEARQAGFR